MNTENSLKQKILIVDDSEFNRAILIEMLGDAYDIIEAENGLQAYSILKQTIIDIDLMLLDIVMPVMDGLELLSIMNREHLIEQIPVIAISAETSVAFMKQAYKLGVTDFIQRPFDITIVHKRISNTLLLYGKQKNLIRMVASQILEREKNNRMMVRILSHIVEFRNGESGMHVLHINRITELLIRKILEKEETFGLTDRDISRICMASSLHDIGKIIIPGSILNKQGILTAAEFAVMKQHTLQGAEMLEDLKNNYEDEEFLKTAYDICRWHHERYDGNGYPDGLKGDEIPIVAQIVSLADVYDALTSKRVYKEAYSHETAMRMILNGECGAFHPMLLQCLVEIQTELQYGLDHESEMSLQSKKELEFATTQQLSDSGIEIISERHKHLLESEQKKHAFFASTSSDVLFEYSVNSDVIMFKGIPIKQYGEEKGIVAPISDPRILQFVPIEELNRIKARVLECTVDNSYFEMDCTFLKHGENKPYRIICKTVWSDMQKDLETVLGRIIEL